MTNFAQFGYGSVDPTAKKQKQFIDEINSPYGSHTSEQKEYYPAIKNWRNLLVPATPERRKEIILGSLNVEVIRDEEQIKSVEEAYAKVDKWIKSVSEKALISFFSNQEVIHDAIIAMKEHNPNQNYGLMVTTLIGDILFHDRTLLKKAKCPARFYEESRLELDEIDCEHTKIEGTGNHRKDCVQYHLSQECDWVDTGYQVGVGRQKFQADLRHMNQLKFKAIGAFISEILSEHDFDYMKEKLFAINWNHPDIYKTKSLQKLFGFSKEDLQFINMFFTEYKHEVDALGNVFTSMRDEYVDIDEDFFDEGDFEAPSMKDLEAIEEEE